ncbi:hypothetical protein ACWDFH_26245 [Streptomyces kronopolitis]
MTHTPTNNPPMTVFTVEVFDTFTAATVGFYPITASSTDVLDGIDGLATELVIAMGHGRNRALDWRQIAEHPYSPAAPDAPALRMVSKQ